MRIGLVHLCLFALLGKTLPYVEAANQAPAVPHLEALETDGSGDQRLALHSILPGGPRAEVEITLLPTQTLQRWDGVGAALTDSAATLLTAMPAGSRTALLRRLFDPRQGGFNLVRLTIGASDFSASGPYTYEPKPGAFDFTHELETTVPVLREVKRLQPNLRLLAAPWSPPGWMKLSGQLNGGLIAPASYPDLAEYLVRYVRQYRDWGLPIDLLSVQNEPQLSRGDYPTALLPAAEEVRLVHDYLVPALHGNGLDDVGILGLEHNWSDLPYARTLATSAAAGDLTGYAFHCYRGGPDAMAQLHPLLRPGQILLTTECSPTQGGGFAQGFRYTMKTLVMGTILNGGSGVMMWNLALDPYGGPRLGGCQNCLGVVTIQPGGAVTYDPAFYALVQVASAVRAGAHVVAARSSTADVLAAAFRNPNGKVVVIAYNAGKTTQRIGLSLGGQRFGYSLPANAAVTLANDTGD